MKEIKIQHHLIKIVGLLGEFPQAKRKQYQNELLKKGYKEDVGSYDLYKILKDVFYPDFRNMMFIKTDDESENNLLSRRFDKKLCLSAATSFALGG